MEVIYQFYSERLEDLHHQIDQVLAGLPQPALDWSPGPGMNSLCVLAVHTAGAERYWVGDVVAQQPSGRDREAEFRAQGMEVAFLLERLHVALSVSRATLEGLTLDDLAARRVSPRDGKEYTIAWALFHALEHTALHLGHMQLTRQVWEQQAGS